MFPSGLPEERGGPVPPVAPKGSPFAVAEELLKWSEDAQSLYEDLLETWPEGEGVEAYWRSDLEQIRDEVTPLSGLIRKAKAVVGSGVLLKDLKQLESQFLKVKNSYAVATRSLDTARASVVRQGELHRSTLVEFEQLQLEAKGCAIRLAGPEQLQRLDE